MQGWVIGQRTPFLVLFQTTQRTSIWQTHQSHRPACTPLFPLHLPPPPPSSLFLPQKSRDSAGRDRINLIHAERGRGRGRSAIRLDLLLRVPKTEPGCSSSCAVAACCRPSAFDHLQGRRAAVVGSSELAALFHLSPTIHHPPSTTHHPPHPPSIHPTPSQRSASQHTRNPAKHPSPLAPPPSPPPLPLLEPLEPSPLIFRLPPTNHKTPSSPI